MIIKYRVISIKPLICKGWMDVRGEKRGEMKI